MTAAAAEQETLERIHGGARSRLRRLRIGLFYWWRHKRWPDLDRPAMFTEWVQWRKLNDRADQLAMLTDKLYSKALVADRCGAHLSVPTVWAGMNLPDDPPGDFPMIVKANHSCGQVRVVRDLGDWRSAQRASRRWVSGTYGAMLDEVQYRAARQLILVEPFLGSANGLPDDYKVYVFGGRAAIVQHHVGRGTPTHRWTQFDRMWSRVGGARSEAGPPATLKEMLDAAERIAAGFDFLRVDFYEVDGRLWFGEFSLFPGSGLDPFEPAALDRQLGQLWSAARSMTS